MPKPKYITDARRKLLLQAATAAKLRYWDALKKLENAMVQILDDGQLIDHDKLSDRQSEAIDEHISVIAAGLDDPDDAFLHITDEHMTDLIDILERPSVK